MSYHYWRSYLAAGGIALAVASAHAQPVDDDTGTQERPSHAQTEPDDHSKPSADEAIKGGIAGVASALEAQINEPKASKKEERAERDLRAQEGMALWTRRMFWAAFFSTCLTAFGIFLIGRTLVHTRRAAEAARDMVEEGKRATSAAVEATKEAKRQADLAEESFKRLERPYVYIFGVSRFEESPSSPARVRYTVANYGRTPATIQDPVDGISFFEKPIKGLPMDYIHNDQHDLLVRPVMPPGDVRKDLFVDAPGNLTFTAGQDHSSGQLIEVSPELPPEEQAFVRIEVCYQGAFGDPYQTSGCWRHDKLTNRLVPWGGEEYNYVK